jgi:ABC-type multidrug transport system fused ATPase/permease subunit
MIPARSAIEYFSTFRKYVGLRLHLVFALTLLGAATEGLGIALLLPLLVLLDVGGGEEGAGAEAVTGPVGDTSGIAGLLRDGLGFLGIQDSMAGILVLMGGVFLLKGAISFAAGGYKAHLKSQLMQELRARLFDAYSGMGYRYYSRHNTGHFVNLLSTQVAGVVSCFTRYIRFVAAVISVGTYFAFAFLLSWTFATMSLVAGGLILVLFQRLNSYVRRLSVRTARENGILNHFLVQTMQAFKYLTATAQIRPLRLEVMQSIRKLSGYQRRQGIASSFTNAVREPLSVAVVIAIIIVQITALNQPLAPILVALVLIHRAMAKLIGVQAAWQATMESTGSLDAVEREFERVSRHQEPTGHRSLAPLSRRIELDRVSFAYDPSEGNVLEDISLTIDANQTVGIVGPSGAGKSTLVDLLTLLLRPGSGTISIDGVHHGEIEVGSWREQIGYVSQETVVFDDTIANNICLWRGDHASDPEVRRGVEEAAERACARPFIDELPEGFNTRVGDRGVRLSGGQRQRLFIARELYKNPRLLILDEATSALDSESELVIKESVDRLRGSTTVVIIAHRLSTIRDADQIYVLEDGRIREQGTYGELSHRPEGVFHRMVALQQL